jgi:hypothetical protein
MSGKRALIIGLGLLLGLPGCTALIEEPGVGQPDASVPPLPDAGDPPPDAPPGFTPSNISKDLLEQGTVPLIVERDQGDIEIDTDTGSIVRASDGASLAPEGLLFTRLSQAEGPDLGVFSVSNLVIERDVTARVRGSAALVFAASGDATIAGVIVAAGGRGTATQAGPGGYPGGDALTLHGQGPGGGRFNGIAGDVGGGGGGHVAPGGSGGDFGASAGGAGGASYGSPELVPLVGGSGGGMGGGDAPYDGNGVGGGGGGAVQISARGSIVVERYGGIHCGGGGGQGGRLDDSGGGGGSGGAILLEALVVELAGTLAANGGGGGAGANADVSGQSGQSGALGNTPALAGTGAGEGTSGGAGGADQSPAGQPGVNSQAIEDTSDNAGAGGGAAGRIRIRTRSGAAVDGIISPLAGFSEGSL